MPIREGRPKWDDTLYVEIYELAKTGLKDAQIASAIGVDHETITNWKRERPALVAGLKKARSQENYSFREYVYKRLPDDLQKIWDEINEVETMKNPVMRMEALLDMGEEGGKKTKQHLFLHALCCNNFNASLACRKVNIPRATMDHWIRDDQDFRRLFEDINWHKGNFFEEYLVKLVRSGDAPATIFANKTFNKKRGYGESVQVEVSGTVNHNLTVVDLTQIDLPTEVMRKILDHIRAQNVLPGTENQPKSVVDDRRLPENPVLIESKPMKATHIPASPDVKTRNGTITGTTTSKREEQVEYGRYR